MYGAFTPAGGIFATLTSMAMLGRFWPVGLLIAIVLATAVALIVWYLVSGGGGGGGLGDFVRVRVDLPGMDL
jgi:hypothetical protein